MQHIGLQTIFLLTCKHPANTLAAGDGGAINLAVRAIRSFPLNSPLLLQAFSLLGQLAVQPQFHEHILNLGAFKLAVSALSRLSKTMDVCGSACYLLVNLTSAEAVASDALSMGAMELALSALRHHAFPRFLGSSSAPFATLWSLLFRNQLGHFCIGAGASSVHEALDASKRTRGSSVNILIIRMRLHRGLKQRGCAKLLRLNGTGFFKAENFQQHACFDACVYNGAVFLQRGECQLHGAHGKSAGGDSVRNVVRNAQASQAVAGPRVHVGVICAPTEC